MSALLLIAPIICVLLGCADAPRPINPSFPVSFSQGRAALAKMESEPRSLARPLVIIGGFMDPNVSPPLFRHAFYRLTGDRRMIEVSVGLCNSFEECRQRVIDAVQEAYPSTDPNWTAEVDVVGASLGGLVGRYAAAPSPDPAHPRRLKIVRLFSISSPHSGAVLAQSVTLTQFHRDMKPGSDFLQKLAATDPQAIYQLYPYTLLHDQIVGEQYAAPPGQSPLWLANPPFTLAHAGAMIDPRILADIGRRLRGERPLSQLPPTPLPGHE